MSNLFPSRSSNDKERDDYLKKQLLDDDPMKDYFKQKELEKLGVKNVETPKYKGVCPPNRYNIRPGYRWDGVDRSNGYEARIISSQAAKDAEEEENYRLRTRDM